MKIMEGNMKIWEMVKNEAIGESIIIDGEESYKFFDNNFYGKEADSWGAVYVKTLKGKKKCDMYEFSDGYPIVSERTVSVLEKYLEGRVQVLPVIYNDNDKLFVLNVTNLIDCLDHERSEIRRLSSGRVGSIDNYVFKYHLLNDAYIFKIPETPRSRIFVNDTFKSAVEEAGLIGFVFIEVWESDEEIVRERQERYDQALAKINDMPSPEYSYGEAQKLVESGQAAVSDKWKLQMSNKNEFVIGQLQEDGSYNWIIPMYIPPILLTLNWKITDRTEI
jgi:hypothetical protein